MRKRELLGVLLLILVTAPGAAAESFTGKVVAVADGDTVTVLRDGTEVKIRLHGVDTPEKAQAFGEQAKRFTSEMVSGKQVRVEVVTRDKYGRTVGKVHLESPARCLNEELLRAGLAWWYRQYAPKETKLAALEAEAKRARRGLWSESSPTPPWAWRHPALGCKQSSDCVFLPDLCPGCAPCKPTPRRIGNQAERRRILEMQTRVRCARPTCKPCADPTNWIGGALACVEGRCTLESHATPAGSGATASSSALYTGNLSSKVLHAPGCRDYRCKRCTAGFARVEDAKRAGYRNHSCVAPFETCYARCLAGSRAEAKAALAIDADCRQRCTK